MPPTGPGEQQRLACTRRAFVVGVATLDKNNSGVLGLDDDEIQVTVCIFNQASTPSGTPAAWTANSSDGGSFRFTDCSAAPHENNRMQRLVNVSCVPLNEPDDQDDGDNKRMTTRKNIMMLIPKTLWPSCS